MGLFKKEKKVVVPLPDEKVETVDIKANKEEVKEEISLEDVCARNPDAWFKAKVLELLAEIAHNSREDENVSSK